ncbi:TetR/AcrR family transcriptional repressor of mexJK operon [Sphingomonas sp. UYAg733]
MIPDSTAPAEAAETAPPDARALRRHAFVVVAREAFFEHGYVQTAMSSIASEVGGSKTTLWSYFPSKQDLFAAVVDDIVERFGAALTIELDDAEAVEPALRRFGNAMMATILAPSIIALHRVVISEARRFPELGELFYARGSRRGKERLARFIAAAMADGRLRRGDPMVAACQFASMCQSSCFQESLLGIDQGLCADRITQDVEAALDSFMRAWSPDSD